MCVIFHGSSGRGMPLGCYGSSAGALAWRHGVQRARGRQTGCGASGGFTPFGQVCCEGRGGATSRRAGGEDEADLGGGPRLPARPGPVIAETRTGTLSAHAALWTQEVSSPSEVPCIPPGLQTCHPSMANARPKRSCWSVCHVCFPIRSSAACRRGRLFWIYAQNG